VDRRIYLCLGLIFSFILMGSQAKPFPLPDQILVQTVQQLNGKVELVNYHVGRRTIDWMSTDQIDFYVQQLAKDLHCLSVQKREDATGVHYQAERTGAAFTTRLYVLNDQPQRKLARPYVSIQIRSFGTWEPTRSVYRQLNKLLLKHHLPPNIHFTLQGRIPAVKGSVQQLIAKTFQLLQAREIEGIVTERFVSSSAISQILPAQGLMTPNGKMNVQAAAKIDQKNDQYLFTIGSPIITIEY